jgi:hypothetical protein
MNHEHLQWLITRVMSYGKFGLLLALMLCKDRGNLVCENTRAWPLLCSLFYVQCAASHTGRKPAAIESTY